jgi:hypothetical protein
MARQRRSAASSAASAELESNSDANDALMILFRSNSIDSGP